MSRGSLGASPRSARVGERDGDSLKWARVAGIRHTASGHNSRGCDGADGGGAVNDRGENASDVGTVGDVRTTFRDGLNASRVDDRRAVGDDFKDDHGGIVAS